MPSELAPPEPLAPATSGLLGPHTGPHPRPLGFELALVVLVSLAVLVPGIWSYSLVDPWETHYGEVGRMMLQNHDWVHTEWPQDGEGFRSKPVLSFWLMAGGMRAVGMAADGGYSGEMVHDPRTMIAIRLPFILCAVFGLLLMWWMLARLVSRRLAWLALLVVGSSPFFCLIARQGIPDMPLAACVMGAFALFTMALEDGDRPIVPLGVLRIGRHRLPWDARHVVLGLAGGFVVVQAIYYALYFALAPQLAVRIRLPSPAVWLPGMMGLMLGALSRDGWLILRLPFLVFGGIIAAIVNEPMPARAPGQTLWRHVIDDVLRPWERHALDRYLVRAILFAVIPVATLLVSLLVLWLVRPASFVLPALELTAGIAVIWGWLGASRPGRWPLPNWTDSGAITNHLLAMSPLTTMRQLYLLGCYALLGISILAKGPPGLAVVGAVGVFYLVLTQRWHALYEGAFELKRGLLVMIVSFLPWHLAMYLKDGLRFIDEYLFTHILNRATVGVDNSPGTFEYYTSQIGHGMWLWAALLPAAIGATLVRARSDTREGRVRFLVALWAIGAVAFFSLVQTKFHHYILPAIPALGLLVAFLLDDVAAGRDRLHPLFALLGIAIVLLICRDLMHEPERWIELFVFRYDRPWPASEPWQIDPSDGFLGLGIFSAIAIAIAATRFRRFGIACLGAAGLAICVWSLQVYMPLAGKHWGMGDTIRTYYQQRTIYGQKLVYFGLGELHDDWRETGTRWTFETHVPEALQVGQPMTLKIQVNKVNDERVMEQELTLIGTTTQITDHTVEVTLPASERARLDPLIARGKTSPRGRPPVRAVDADRLIAWQLYWRGENFWSGDEIWGFLPEMKTAFVKTDNVEFTKYINDRTRTPLGRRYFLVTEAGRITSVRAMLPTQRARDTFEVVDTTSNKFSLAAFWL
ncbi:MAG TPA: glycosyltransferase family 39 protein [Kofleriaceae bacterium]|jgi:4-amino-4-deoxy-L-arabinose transferase-like glycosyltransferase|nr:glycosyltransferase family 39 protein [Kofleriaceae bacterium]